MTGRIRALASRLDQWFARSWPWAWDVTAVLRPLAGIPVTGPAGIDKL